MNRETPSNAIELLVEGMHCGGCVSRIQKTLSTNEAVTSVEVDLDEKRVLVSGGETLRADQIVASLGEQGFAAKLINYKEGGRLTS